MLDPSNLSQASSGKSQKKPESLTQVSSSLNVEFKERSVKQRADDSAGKYGYVDIAATPINPDLFVILDADILAEASLIPFFRLGSKLRVALNEPENPKTVEAIAKLESLGYSVQQNLASVDGIQTSLKQFIEYKKSHTVQANVLEKKDIETYQKELENLSKLTENIQLSSAKEGVLTLLIGAIRTKASDIHMQPETDSVKLRFRIDGILQTVSQLDLKIYDQVLKQIKYDSGMKLNVSDVPQDGRMMFTTQDRKVDVRASALPTENGETLVMRLLDSGKKFLTLEELGFNKQHLEILEKVCKLSQGMILVTGPTGSGKTTTLYSMLNIYNKPERKIITLEDPVEYHLENIVQSQIHEDKGYTFASGLESILRQDPDVVMIGEIREYDTANTAMQASLTGHVVLTTIHTNSALESVNRLMNIGLEPYLIAPSLDTVLAQRLARTFCPKCSTTEAVSAEDKKNLEKYLQEITKVTKQEYQVPAELPKANGCDICNHTGYLGRVVIAEVIRLDQELKELILNKTATHKLQQAALGKGMITMFMDGILKVLAGKTSLSEILRVCSR
ncbi:type II/IV secretion system protein [bacterium]|nr:type II/IV secretion system protein [bacterium]